MQSDAADVEGRLTTLFLLIALAIRDLFCYAAGTSRCLCLADGQLAACIADRRHRQLVVIRLLILDGLCRLLQATLAFSLRLARSALLIFNDTVLFVDCLALLLDLDRAVVSWLRLLFEDALAAIA